MAEDKISSYIDLVATEQETAQFIGMLDRIGKKYDELNAIKLSLEGLTKTRDIVKGAQDASAAVEDLAGKVIELQEANERIVASAKGAAAANAEQAKSNQALSNSFDELVKQQIKNETAGRQLKEQRKDLDAQMKSGKISAEQYAKSLEEIKKEEIGLRVSNNELARALRNTEKEAQAASGSLNEMRAQLNRSLQAFDALSEAERGSDVGVNLKQNIEKLTKSISEQEQTTGRFQRQVGNYRNGAPSVLILGKALEDVKKKIDDVSKAGNVNADVIEQLQKEEALLTQLLNSQVTGFATSTAEVRKNTEALQQMKGAGLEGTEAYRALFAATSDLKDETADLKKALDSAAPDDVAFNAAADAARGLVGVYGLAKSVTAAFGIENEALQETMVKLQAAETALQSIEAIRAVFKKENAVMQAVTLGRQKIEILQTNLQSAAESKNTIIKYGAIVAQKALNAVMQINPIVAVLGLLLALSAAYVALTSKVDTAAKSFGQLNDELDINSQLTEQSLQAIQDAGEKIVAELEANFADEKTIREKKTEFLEKQLAKQAAHNEKERAKYEEADEFIRESIARRDELSDKEQENLDAAIAVRDKYEQESEKQYQLEHKLDLQRISDKKAATEEFIKASQDSLEVEKIALQTRASALQATAGDDSKQYAERISALQEFLVLQERIVNNDARKQRLAPGQTSEEIALIEANRTAAIIQARRESAKQIASLNNENIDREKKAQFEIAKVAVQQQADAAMKIAENENKSLADRMTAQVRYFELEKSLISAQLAFDLDNKKLLESERKALSDKARADELKAQQDFLEKSYELQLSALASESERAGSGSNKKRDTRIRELNEQFEAGLITQEQYNERRLGVEERYAQDALSITIDYLDQEIQKRRDNGENVEKLEADLANLRAQQSDKSKEKIISDEDKIWQKRKEGVENYAKIANNVFAAFGELSAQSADKEFAQIEEQIAAIEKKKEADIEAANQSIANAQDKAAAISTIEIRANAQKEALERKRRQVEIEQARFQKFANIARIISDTAVAVVTTLGDKTIVPAYLRPVLAATIGALGAAQLSRAISAPLPKYALGTEDHPGGPAVVGDAGRRELIIRPDGKLQITDRIPQVIDLPKHSMVLPDAEAALRDAGRASTHIKLDKISKEYDLNKAMISAYQQGTKQIVETIKSKNEIHVNGTHAGVAMFHKKMQEHWEYINQQVNF